MQGNNKIQIKINVTKEKISLKNSLLWQEQDLNNYN